MLFVFPNEWSSSVCGFVNTGDGFSCVAFPDVNEKSRSTSRVSKDIEGRKEPQRQKDRIISGVVFKRACDSPLNFEIFSCRDCLSANFGVRF